MVEVVSVEGRSGRTDFASVLVSARRGKAWAYEHLFHLVGDPLLGYLRAQGAEDADVIVNDVLMRALTQLDGFEGGESGFRAWVFTIARCRLIDERRARQRRIGAQTLGPASEWLPGGDAEDDAMAELGSEWVAAILDSLAPDQRDVLLLRIVSDLSIEETSMVLAKTPGAVKALQHRALASIRRKISVAAVSI
jgi:RNA polymerase sigma-70 factor (ECF subfamily)